MQSKPSKNRNGRGANAAEKAFQGWVKYQPCCWCGSESGSIVDHVVGAKTGHNKVHIGHWFVLPNCEVCDKRKTVGGEKLGDYSSKWVSLHYEYAQESGLQLNIEVFDAITNWGEGWKNG
tara:strand:- start:268 stop:627 length:360 start_codon:yes stop_codon:yes gene_type:complete